MLGVSFGALGYLAEHGGDVEFGYGSDRFTVECRELRRVFENVPIVVVGRRRPGSQNVVEEQLAGGIPCDRLDLADLLADRNAGDPFGDLRRRVDALLATALDVPCPPSGFVGQHGVIPDRPPAIEVGEVPPDRPRHPAGAPSAG